VPNFENKVAIITGASRGTGAAYGRSFAAAGASVVLADVRDDEGRAVADEINAGGGKALYVNVDITDLAATQQMAATAAETFGGVDILVNNAALFAGLEAVSVLELDPARWDKVMEVNVKGLWLCVRAVAPHMRARGGGAIVNQASIAAFGIAGTGRADYGTSKAAVIGFTKVAARELAADNIRINTVAPGGIVTEAALGMVGGDANLIEQYAASTQLIPRAIQADDMADPVMFLAGDESRFMTGQTLVVDGGKFFLG
jgi:NAD(P)-dependent dehydrogenase (short-subunit alcohol dehydrogenase family)